MTDKDKIIKAIKCRTERNNRCGNPCEETGNCHYAKCMVGLDGEPYYPFVCDTEQLCTDVLAILKEQEARILDWDELEDWANAVWFEDKDEHECYIALIANVGTYDAKFVNVEPGMVHRLDFLREFYKKEWRCWSARPTIKQRQAMKWE